MKMKVFIGKWDAVMNAFNKWAKGKKLSRDVIVHTHVQFSTPEIPFDYVAVVVFHPDETEWDSTGDVQ